jgi:hypothetical protein
LTFFAVRMALDFAFGGSFIASSHVNTSV